MSHSRAHETQQDLSNADFSAHAQEQIKEIISHYPTGRQKSAILPILHIAQTEYGWLNTAIMDKVATILEIAPIEVYEVASFYTMFHLDAVGKYVLEVCRTGPCMICGAEEIIAYLEQKTGAKLNHTSSDGLFTIKEVECLAACGGAPCMQVKLKTMDGAYKYYENLSPSKIDELIANEWV